ncbi:MAG: hypothetical protein ACRDN0_35580 [Trebonia sp.]
MVGPSGGVPPALDGAGELHPSGERLAAVAAAVEHDAGDRVGPKIEDEREPGMVRNGHGIHDVLPAASATSCPATDL